MKDFKISIVLILVFLLFNCSIAEAVDLEPSIKGEAAITIDVNTKEIIYTKNIDKQMYPASLTKLITAILLDKNKSKTDILTYSSSAKSQEPTKLDLKVNDKMTAANAMDSMLLNSDNDIAYMIGENVGGTIPIFADMMNSLVKDFHLKNTHFITPNGLHNINHYTTAYDLSVIAQEALNYPWIVSTINKKTSSFKTSKNESVVLKNTNKLLGIDGCIGGKTGYTGEAGRCLFTLYERSGRKIIGIVLNSEMDTKDTAVFLDMEKIINYSFEKEKTIAVKSNTILKTLQLTYKAIPYIGPSKTIKIPLFTNSDISYYSNDINSSQLSFDISNINVWKLFADKSVGEVSLNERDTTKKLPLFTSITVNNIIGQNIGLYLIVSVICLIIIRILQFYVLSIIRKRKSHIK